jgi:hypothetical protein
MVEKLLGQRIRQCIGVAADHRIVATILDFVDLLHRSGERRAREQSRSGEQESRKQPVPRRVVHIRILPIEVVVGPTTGLRGEF